MLQTKEVFDMKEQYTTPNVEIITFDAEDVITTSNATKVLDPFAE